MLLTTQFTKQRHPSWESLDKELDKEYFKKLDTLYTTYSKDNGKPPIFPELPNIFNTYKHPVDNYRVLLLGQDPYPSLSEDKDIACTADGYAFSTKQKETPPSLKVIFNELERSFRKKRTNNNLEDWVRQGVMLLNTALTVEHNKPNGHGRIGWQYFTIRSIVVWLKSRIENKDNPAVVVLWGNQAKDLWSFIEDNFKDLDKKLPKLLILRSAHPAADKHGNIKLFVGNNHFIEINNYIKDNANTNTTDKEIDFVGGTYSKPYIECLYTTVVNESVY